MSITLIYMNIFSKKIIRGNKTPNVSAAPRKSLIDSLSLCICYKYFTILHSIAQFYTIVRYILGYNYDENARFKPIYFELKWSVVLSTPHT